MPYIEVSPAYGKDYTSQAKVKADWSANADFRDTVTGRYINKADAERLMPDAHVMVRYSHLTKVVQVS